MKKQFKSLIIVLLVLPFLGFSNNDFGFTKQKSISKAYIVNSDAGVDIVNSYGTIFVTTWNEDKIQIDVLIKVSGNSEKWVTEKLESIDVEFNALKSMVSAKTVFDKIDSRGRGNNNNFEINYTVKIPKNGTVKLNNRYGNIGTADLFSSADINCQYGKINLGKLNGNNNTIKISYCSNSTVEFIKSGSVNSRYSGLKLDETGKLDLISDYSEIEIGQGSDVKYTSRYGSVKIKNVNTLDANGSYLTIYVGSLSNQLKLSARYSNVSLDVIQAKAGNVNIEASYTGINIGFSPNYTFDFDVAVKYGDFKYDDELSVNSRAEAHSSKNIGGFYKKKGENKVVIISNYGNVRLFKKDI